MKPTKHILLLAALLLCSLTASAEDFEVDGICYNITSETDLTVEVTYKGNDYDSYSNEYSSSITLPSTVTYYGNTYNVTSIGETAFRGCSSLTAITIPEGVTSIGDDAFAYCSSLTAVHISSLEAWCNIDFEDSGANPLSYAKNLYLNGELVTELAIPNSVTAIKEYAFSGCSSLTAITIPEGVTSIGYGAFRGCSSLTAITLPESVTSIGDNAFAYCSSLTAITLPEGVTSIGSSAFEGCINLSSITIPESVTSIGYGAFFECSSLTSITIPENSQLTSIGDYAFYGCSSLTSITIPEGVTSIGNGAFWGCSSLTSITLPESVTSIGSSAFDECSSLTSITIPENSQLTSIGDYAFYGCSSLTSITLPESVTSIGDNAFQSCSSLTSITLPESVTSIGDNAFQSCSNLTSITLPKGLTSIGGAAFQSCSGLTSITLPEGVTSIGDVAFQSCSSLTSITLPEGVTSIGNSAFYNCSNLTTITCNATTPPAISNSYAFYGVNKSIPVYVPTGSVEAYQSAAYWNEFANIKGVVSSGTCGDNLTWKLTEDYELVIEGTGDMYDYSSESAPWYEHRESIQTITMGEGVTSIGEDAFNGCSSLSSITCKAVTPPTAYSSTFYEIDKSIPVYVPAGSVEAYQSAAYWSEFTNYQPLSSDIASGTCGDNLTWKLTEEYELIIEGTGTMTNYSSSAYVPWYNFKTSIKGVTLSEGVTSIGDYAFYDCSSLAAINIPEGVTGIGAWSFYNCSSLTTVNIPASVKNIWLKAFSGCSALATVNIPENSKLLKLGERIFESCGSLNAIYIPAGVKNIGSHAFSGCNSLSEVHASSIEAWCNILFGGYYSNPLYYSRKLYINGEHITDLTVPISVTALKQYAFDGCSSLTSVTLPVSLTSIGNGAFSGCSGITNMYCYADNVPSVEGNPFDNSLLESATLSVPENVLANYQSTAPWSSFATIMGLAIVPEQEFSNEKVYTLRSNRAFLLYSEVEGINHTLCTNTGVRVGTVKYSLTEPNLQFSIKQHGGNYYLYSIGAGKYVGASGAYEETPNTVLSMQCVGGDYPWKLVLGGKGMNSQVPNQTNTGIMINDWLKTDAGNCYQITEAKKILSSGTCGDNLTWKLTEEYELIIEGTGEMYDYTQGGTPWNEYRDAILSITLPEGMTRIGHWAFSDCTSITTITVPASVTSIGYGILMGCNSLTSIAVEEGNTIYDSRNGCNAIIKTSNNTLVSGCSATIIPEGVTSIGNRAFGYCTFTTIDIPEGVTSIGDYAFGYCGSLTTITLPESMTAVGTGAFVGCRKLAELTSLATTPPALGSNTTFGNVNKAIPVYVPAKSVEAYQSAAYWNEFANIKGVVASGTCGDNLTWRLTEEYELVIEGTGDMYDYFLETTPWYEYRESIQTITLPEGVTSIGEYAFCDCSSLTSITIPENVASIGESAFNGCSSLSSVIIPESVTSIGKLAFAWCSNLITITVADGNAVYDSRGGCNAIIETSSNTLITGCSTTIIPESVTGIGYGAFNGHSGLLAITIPEGVTNFGLGAFSYCNSLTNLTIPESVTSIGEQAFEGCSSLTAIAIPEGVTSIRYRSFHGCSNLTEITLPENVTSIGAQAFEGCSSLTSITIPEGVTSIGVYAFDGTAWYDNQPDGVIYAGKVLYMYKGTMPANTSVEVKEGTVSITGFAFDGCSSLTSITIPESVTSIEYNAFDGCYALTAITCHAVTPPTIYSSTFGNVNKSIPVYVPAASVGAYQSAAYWSEFTNILPIEEPTPDYVTITISKYGSGTYSSAYALDFSEVQGLKAYVATGYNYHTGVVTLLRVHTADAATGLLVKGTPGASYEVPVMEYTADRTLNMLVPTLERTEVDSRSSDGVYANYKYTVDPAQNPDEPLFYPFADDSHLSAGKAYLQIPVAWLPDTGQKSIRYRFDEGETTDIEDEEIINQKSEIIYDLYGRRVVSPKKGEIYIINNQKVVY